LAFCLLPCDDTIREALIRPKVRALIPDFPASRGEAVICVIYKLLSLKYSAVAAQIDQDKLSHNYYSQGQLIVY
jgi:hypothetical protein